MIPKEDFFGRPDRSESGVSEEELVAEAIRQSLLEDDSECWTQVARSSTGKFKTGLQTDQIPQQMKITRQQ